MEKKVKLPLQWDRPETSPDDVPKWIAPYQQHLDRYSRIPYIGNLFRFQLLFVESLPERWPVLGVSIPGETPGSDGVVHGRVTSPFTIRLSMRVRASLYFGRDGRGRGAQVLFQCFAHLEAMQQRPFAWPVLWMLQHEKLQRAAELRGKDLLDLWEKHVTGWAAPTPALPGTVRVLLVDDELYWRRVGRIYLEDQGCSVFEAASGSDAVRMAAQIDFDLVLMDLLMPDQNGRQVTQALRDLGCHAPVLSITAADPDLAADVAAGIDGAMPKPWTPDGVAAMLARWGPGARQAQPPAPEKNAP